MRNFGGFSQRALSVLDFKHWMHPWKLTNQQSDRKYWNHLIKHITINVTIVVSDDTKEACQLLNERL